VHEGAIYQVQGETWKVERFDYENRRAYVRAVESDYFTEAEVDTTLRVLRLEKLAQRLRDGGEEDFGIHTGEVHVTTVATQYKKIRFYTRENVGTETIHLPPEELDTQAFVLTISNETANDLGLTGSQRGAAWRGAGGLLRKVAPLYLRCQPQDLGLSTEVRSTHFLRPAIVLYDRVQGGVGLSEVLFESYRDVLRAALEVVAKCECQHGCPACVGPKAECGELGKVATRKLLEHLVAGTGAQPREPEVVA
jgi:DEAD/DEAH box helicase domain-containing protein